jgi:hypothetical protein
MRGLLLRTSMRAYEALYWRPVDRRAAAPASVQREVLERFSRIIGTPALAASTALPTFVTRRSSGNACRSRTTSSCGRIDEQRHGAPALTKETRSFTRRPAAAPALPSPSDHADDADVPQAGAGAVFLSAMRACPAAFDGKAWGIMGASVEGHLDTGQVVGSVSGRLCPVAPRVIQSRFVVPPEVAGIATTT